MTHISVASFSHQSSRTRCYGSSSTLREQRVSLLLDVLRNLVLTCVFHLTVYVNSMMAVLVLIARPYRMLRSPYALIVSTHANS